MFSRPQVVPLHILSFLTTGESIEENAYVVLRLLIRRPECFGPALRGDGGNGLLAAMEEAIRISDDPSMDGPCRIHQQDRAMSVFTISGVFLLSGNLGYSQSCL